MNKRQQRQQLLQRQVHRLERRLNQLQETSQRLSRLRLVIFLIGTAVSLFTLFRAGVWAWTGVSILAALPFAWAVSQHRHVESTIRQHKLWQQIKQTHLARMALDWKTIPATLPRPVRLEHPFALDLDLVGDRSLHQLLDTAVSHAGSERLREWLLSTQPDPEAITRRQALVQDLITMPRFCDRLTLYATLAVSDDEPSLSRDKWPGQRVLDWLAQQENITSLRKTLVILSTLAIITIPLFLLAVANVLPPVWLLTWVPFVLLSGAQTRSVGPLFKDANFLADGLRKLQAVFGYLETYRYGQHTETKTVCQPFLDTGKRPSHQLKRVTRIISAAGIQYNPMLWLLLNAVLPWDIYFAWRMQQLKGDLQTLLPCWLDVWAELEALSALATFAYLHPTTVFPQIDLVNDPSTPLFRAEALGHPLIVPDNRIHNDFHIDKLGSVTIITGSNMAGKSSFLRTLGINLCLAYAGGPVVAQTLQTHLFRLYTSIQVADSVTDGFSFFYAEVRRLQSMLTALQQGSGYPLFFLIDEIFRGTNNRERLIGSRAYVQALVGEHGIGAIATHDLELVKLADDSPQIRNFHFRDDVENGRMVFDYKLHPGPCPTTNALKIMQLAGLPVPQENG